MELEREQNDLLLIAHESVLRVLYGYLMALNAADIPKLEFPRDEIIEVSVAGFQGLEAHIAELDATDHTGVLPQRRQAHTHTRLTRSHFAKKS